MQMDTVANNAAARTRRGGSLVDASTFYQGTADCISVVNITMHINPWSCSCSAPSIFSSFLRDRLNAIVPSSAAVVASRRLHNFPARTSPPLQIGPSKLVIPLVSRIELFRRPYAQTFGGKPTTVLASCNGPAMPMPECCLWVF